MTFHHSTLLIVGLFVLGVNVIFLVQYTDYSTISNLKAKNAHYECDPCTYTEGTNRVECLRLSKMLETWPEDKPKATVYYLIGHRFNYINDSLRALSKFFNHKYQYPIILFHTHIPASRIAEIKAVLPGEMVFLQTVEFRVPDFITKPIPLNIPCGSMVTYRHMCRFHAKRVYEQPIMAGLDYAWRLDDDSFILGNVTYDVFRYLRDHRLLYGYNRIKNDSLPCVTGLWQAARDFAMTNNMSTEFLSTWPEPRVYYNNCEISALSIWRSARYRQYIEYIDRVGGIFFHRWGDNPIKALAVAMFVPESKRHYFTDIPYRHQRFSTMEEKP